SSRSPGGRPSTRGTTPESGARFQPPRGCTVDGVARLVGINHVALVVGDVDEALAWYGRFFDLELRGRAGSRMAFIALAAGRRQPPDEGRHFGLVVDDREAVRAALLRAGIPVQSAGGLDLVDPWGNHVQVV